MLEKGSVDESLLVAEDVGEEDEGASELQLLRIITYHELSYRKKPDEKRGRSSGNGTAC